MFRFFLLLLCFIIGHFSSAQDFLGNPSQKTGELSIFDEAEKEEPLKVSLLSGVEKALQGEELWVVIELKHGPKWHSYWKNPGGVSLPIQFQLDVQGGKAGEILWPQPHRIDGPNGMTFSYEGNVAFPVKIIPEDNAQEIQISAKVRVQLCDDKVCLPPKAYDAQLSLPLESKQSEDSAGNVLTASMAALKETMPQSSDVYELQTTIEGKSLVFRLTVKKPDKAVEGTRPVEVYPALSGVLAQWKPEITTVELGGVKGWNIRFPEFEEDLPTQQALSEMETLIVFDEVPVQGHQTKTLRWVQGADAQENPGLVLQADAKKPAFKPTSLPAGELTWLFGMALIGGLILNVMPCVFPVLGLKIVSFVKQSGSDKHKIVLHGLFFTSGVLLCYLALGLIVLSVRAQGNLPTWGTMFSDPQVVWVVLLLIFLLGLNMAGVFEFGDSLTSAGGSLSQKGGYAGSFFSGLFATIVGTPCAAPFLGTALGAAFTLPGHWSIMLLLTMGLGLSLPYLLFSLFPQLVKFLPKPGDWMVTFKQLMAFSMFAAAAYFIYILSLQTREAFLSSSFALVIVAMAAWVMGRWNTWEKPSRIRWIAGITSLVTLTIGTLYGWPASDRQKNEVQSKDIAWEEWTPEKEKQILAAGGTVLVDYTAAWCPTCLVNKSVWKKPEVQKLIREKKITLLKADWTNPNPDIDQALAKLGKVAIPVNTLQGKDMEIPFIFKELLMTSDVLEALRQIPDVGVPTEGVGSQDPES